MSLDNNHIDFEQIKNYFSGNLTELEKNALEQKALDDPFLQDAMDGFAENPDYSNEFDKQFKKHNPFKQKKSIAIRSLTIIGVLSAVYVIVLVLSPSTDQMNDELVDVIHQDSIISMEIEILPVELETLQVVQENELITFDEIVDNKIEIQKEVQYDSVSIEEKIVIDEDDSFNTDFEIIEEDRILNDAENVPATFLFDMYVVDYRRIKRENNLITYIRYELSGTSAELESEESTSENDLIEQKVDVPYFDYLRSSMEYFKDGYYKKALNRYKTILEQYENDANALFYGGLCYYNMKKFNNSIVFFDRIEVIELNAFKEEAKWYKSKCLIKLGKINEALELLDEIIVQGGYYLEHAIEAKRGL